MSKKIILLLVVVLVLTFYSVVFAVRFISMADSRGDDQGVNSEVLAGIVNIAVKEKVDFVIFAGDMVSGSHNTDIVKTQYKKWKEIMKPIYEKMPVYVVPGNHEIHSSEDEELFKEEFNYLPDNGPEDYKKFCYTVDYENVHIIALDTNIYGRFHKMPYARWLKEDIEKNKDKIVFVFGHEPAFPVGPHVRNSLDAEPKTRERFWKLLVEYKIKAYFCGHEHFYDRKLINGVYQIINGTCGAPIYAGYSAGEFYHYIVVDVKKDKIEFTVKDETGAIRESFSILPNEK